MNEKQPQLAPGLIWRILQEETVVVLPVSGHYCVLNGSGTMIWQLLVENCSLAEIEARLMEHFALGPEQTREDIGRFLTDLQQRGLLVEGN
jgi:hypothetical protein